jgi:hypothetical protein
MFPQIESGQQKYIHCLRRSGIVHWGLVLSALSGCYIGKGETST